jgi:hypothetical protein
MDVDMPNCSTRMNVYRNLGGVPGGDVVLQEQLTGTDCQNVPFTGDCLVGGIPANRSTAVFDVAVFDLDGDGWKDMVLGKCSGTEVWMQVEPSGLVISYPIGLPAYLTPGEPQLFQARVQSYGSASHVAGSGTAWFSVAGGPFEQLPTTPLDDDLYQITIPAIESCGTDVRFYFTVESGDGATFTDPPGAPDEAYQVLNALGTAVTWIDDSEGAVSGWSVVVDPSTTAGVWERVEPVGAIDGFGNQSAPDGDAEAPADKTKAWVTQNPQPGQGASDHDVDGGPIDLISPPLQAHGDAYVKFSRWYYRNVPADRPLEVAVRSNPQSPWVLMKNITAPAQAWQPESFRVGEFVEPSGQVQLRFRVADNPLAALVEAGVDVLRVERFVCNECAGAAECDDGVFCNGAEDCLVGSCVPASAAACPGAICDEELDACFVPPAACQIPDGVLPGEPLRVAHLGGDAVSLSWGASCLAGDANYAVYSGELGHFAEAGPATCSTDGALSWQLDEPGDRFYLVVPINEWHEGSYGTGPDGTPRPPATAACRPQLIGTCDEAVRHSALSPPPVGSQQPPSGERERAPRAAGGPAPSFAASIR